MSDTDKRPVKPDLKWETDLSAPWYWFGWIMECIVYGLSKSTFFKILEYAGKLTILFALILYFREAPQRKRQAELNAWQIVNSALNQKAASGRVEALEYLNNAGVDLNFLEVPNAYLVGSTKERRRRGINLPDAKLYRANFTQSTLIKANFRNANLKGANLVRADLMRADLMRATLVEANLQDARLIGADLTGAFLDRANLSGADFSAAHFVRAHLSEATLQDARLIGADLTGAFLERAKWITSNQLCESYTLYEVKLDSELLKEVEKKCPELLEKPEWVE